MAALTIAPGVHLRHHSQEHQNQTTAQIAPPVKEKVYVALLFARLNTAKALQIEGLNTTATATMLNAPRYGSFTAQSCCKYCMCMPLHMHHIALALAALFASSKDSCDGTSAFSGGEGEGGWGCDCSHPKL